jgi:hypothetical protein
VTVHLMSSAGNYALVKREGRKYPALLIAGDTLSILKHALDEAGESVRSGDAETLADALGEALELVGSMVDSYEAMMSQCGVSLPYAR